MISKADGGNRLDLLHWGLIPFGAKEGPEHGRPRAIVINFVSPDHCGTKG